jgi:hypothetical protein
MFILTNELGIQATQFDARVIGCELPVDLGSTKIAIVFPSSRLVRQALPVAHRQSAASCPSSTHRRRTLKTVLAATLRASATWASPFLPWSALSRIRVRVIVNADAFPLRTKASGADLSVSDKRTMNTFCMATSLYCRGKKQSIRPEYTKVQRISKV